MIDPHNNVLNPENSNRIRERLNKILQAHKDLFEATVGNVGGDEFLVRAKIDPDKSDRAPESTNRLDKFSRISAGNDNPDNVRPFGLLLDIYGRLHYNCK